MPNRDELLAAIRSARTAWESALARLTPGQMVQPGAAGPASVKDIVAHIGWSENEVLRMLEQRTLAGASPLWELDEPARNAAVLAQSWPRPLDEVMKEERQTYGALLSAISKLSEEELHNPARYQHMPADWQPWRIIAGSTYGHYEDHLPDLARAAAFPGFLPVAVGVVRSPVSAEVDEGWGDITAEIHMMPEYAAGLSGLNEFSHALIISALHKGSFRHERHVVRRPRGRADLPAVGIFAQRARHRPNPLAISAVEIVAVRPGVLVVKGLDAVDGTPVLDIKPYVPSFDARGSVRTPGWMDEIMKGYF